MFLFFAEGAGGVDAGNAQCRQCGGEKRHGRKREHDRENGRAIVNADPIKDAAHDAQGPSRKGQPQNQTQ